MDAWKLVKSYDERAWRNFDALQAALGHMRNAIIDLQTGETKAHAIRTLERGIANARALANSEIHTRDGEEPNKTSPENK